MNKTKFENIQVFKDDHTFSNYSWIYDIYIAYVVLYLLSLTYYSSTVHVECILLCVVGFCVHMGSR